MSNLILKNKNNSEIVMDTFILNWLTKIALAGIAALAPVHTVMIVVGILIFFDLFTGIWAACKRSEKISSAALRRTVSKMLIYQIAVMTAFLVENYLLGGLIPG